MLILPTLFLCDVFARFPLTFVSILSWYLQSGRLVFKSPWSRSWNSKSASDLVKIKNRSRKWSHKLDENRVGRMRTLPVSSDSSYDYDAYDPVKTKLSESQAEAEEPTNHIAGFILRLTFTTPTPTIQFSLNHKHRSHKRRRKKMEPF